MSDYPRQYAKAIDGEPPEKAAYDARIANWMTRYADDATAAHRHFHDDVNTPAVAPFAVPKYVAYLKATGMAHLGDLIGSADTISPPGTPSDLDVRRPVLPLPSGLRVAGSRLEMTPAAWPSTEPQTHVTLRLHVPDSDVAWRKTVFAKTVPLADAHAFADHEDLPEKAGTAMRAALSNPPYTAAGKAGGLAFGRRED